MTRLPRILLSAAALAITIVIVINRISWDEMRQRLDSMEPSLLLALLALTVATRLPQAEALRRSLPIHCSPLSYSESFWAISIKALFNQVFAGVGLMAQAVRLRVSHDIVITDFAHATWIQFVAQVLAVAVAGLLSGIALADYHAITPTLVILPWIALLLVGVMLWRAPQYLLRLPFVDAVIPAQLANTALTATRFIHLLCLQLVILLFRLARLGLIVWFIAPDIPVPVVIFAFMVGELALVFPVTPGGIGFRELLLGAGAVGTAGEQLILAGLVDRAAAISVTLALGAAALLKNERSDRISR